MTSVLPSDPDPGTFRSIQRATSEAGFFEVCALDHLVEFVSLLSDDAARVSFRAVVEAKAHLIRELGPLSSAVLLDARFGMQAILTGDVPRGTGIIAAIEDETYTFPTGPRGTHLRDDWGATKIRMVGADMVKLLWFYRPDLDPVVAEQQRTLLRTVHADCGRVSLPLIVEPIWYAVQGEDPTSAAWQQARVDGILRSVREADGIGADVLKVEFPGYLDTPSLATRAAEACAEISAIATVPWVVLSAGVGYGQFTEQVEIACSAGASGYMAGRSVWSDAVRLDRAEREVGLEAAKARLAELTAITRRHGTPAAPPLPLDGALAAMPDGWYEGWHRD